MMQPKFTPGPWNFHRSYPLDSEVRTIAASEDGSHPAFDAWSASIASGDTIIAEAEMRTATGGWPHVTDMEEARANATLIAAAPDMYEALEALLECADDFAKRVGWPDNKPREAARTALAKAGRA